ncbi:MAG: SH3 domain-containing protein, partial [Gammaproteobacteria bacterium]|nr:SH3 domain-containing protein [Gammaproteobacteria bacterium]
MAALNIREGPGVGYPIIEVARAGDVFDVVGTNLPGDWFQVDMGSDENGWISGQPYSRLLTSARDNVPVVEVSPPAPSSSTSAGQAAGGEGKLIFMTGSGGDLYAFDLAEGRLQSLTTGVIDPVVSPNGEQVAFTRWDGAELGAVYIINVDGSNERLIKNDLRQPKS